MLKLLALLVLSTFVMTATAGDELCPHWDKDLTKLEKEGKPITYLLAMGSNTNGLQKADEDAKAFAEGYEKYLTAKGEMILSCVLQNEDTTHEKYKLAMGKLKKLLDSDEAKALPVLPKVFFYFSGHGSFKSKFKYEDIRTPGNCRYTVLLVGGDGEEGPELLEKRNLMNPLIALNTSKLSLFLDNCHASGTVKTKKLNNCDRFAKKGLGHKSGLDVCPISPKTEHARTIFSNSISYVAALENGLAYETTKGGLLTHVFLSLLSTAPADKSFDDVFKEAIVKVKEHTSNRDECGIKVQQAAIFQGGENLTK